MKSNFLKKIQFMPKSRYSSIAKADDNLYLVEFNPNVSTFPDYNKGITLTNNTTYTVGTGKIPNSGWYRIGFTSSSWHGREPQLTTTINGQKFFISYGCAFTMIYLTKGDTFSFADERNGNYWSKVNARFFPIKEM